MISPLDALSALGQVQAPLAAGTTLPTGGIQLGQAAPVSESFGSLLQSAPVAPEITAAHSASGAGPATWGHMVQQMVMDVNHSQQNATALVTDVLKGGPTPVHQAMVASEEASLSFAFLSEARNKVVEAYNQVMQMQV